MTLRTARNLVLFVLTANALSWGQVSMAASSEFKPALEEIRKAFQDQTGIPTRVVYGSSGAMAHRAKAPGTDLFFASDKNWADSLAATSRAEGAPILLASQPVCTWIRGSELEPAADLDHLGELSPGEIVLADTLLSPDGVAVVKALHTLPNWKHLRQRLVVLADPGTVVDSLTAQHASASTQPVTKDTLANSDSAKPSDSLSKKRPPVAAKKPISLANGFLPQPLLWSTSIAGAGRWVPVDSSLIPMLHPTVILLKSLNIPRGEASKAFLAFLQAPRARAILRSKGFLPPP